VSFSYSVTVAKPTDVKAAIEQRRDRWLADQTNPTAELRAEVRDLSDVAQKALVVAVKGLPAGTRWHLSVAGNRDTDGTTSLSLSAAVTP
jgi:hypothetical protein